MAILAPFSACILIDGTPCKKYVDQESEEQGEKTLKIHRKVIKYIEVLADAHFTVRVQREKTIRFMRANGVELSYFLDGKEIGNDILMKDEVNANKIPDFEGRGVGNGSSIRPLKFGEVKFRDTETTDRAALLEGKYAELGTLTIKIWLVTCTKASEVGSFSDLEEGTDAIPEAAVKGGAASVRASFGEEEPCESGEIEWFDAVYVGQMPLAEFSFKCRTRGETSDPLPGCIADQMQEDLQRLSVLPRPQSPTLLEDRPIESLTFEETKELLRRKKIVEEASRVKIKQEKKAANLRELASIKRSRDEAEDDDEMIEVIKVLKKKRTEPPNVIELD